VLKRVGEANTWLYLDWMGRTEWLHYSVCQSLCFVTTKEFASVGGRRVRKSCGLWDLRQNFCLHLVTTPIQLGGRGHTLNQSVAHIWSLDVELMPIQREWGHWFLPLMSKPPSAEISQWVHATTSPFQTTCGSMSSASQSQYYSLFSSPQSSSVSSNRPSLGWCLAIFFWDMGRK
jgi:hypothetical protein